MWISIFLIAHLLGLLSSIDSVMNTRTTQGAIAWAISLNTIPYVAVPAYWILGRSRFLGYVTARQGSDGLIRSVGVDAGIAAADYRVSLDEVSMAGQAAEKLVGMPYLNGNNVELLVDGDATFDSILAGIDQAEKYVLFQFFIVHDDEIGRAVKERLVSKAKRGVKVHFLYDEIGSLDLPGAYKQELRAAGVEVSAFNTRKGRGNRFQVNFRNHRKVVVVDGAVSWIGGHNVGDEYLSRVPKFGHWRDTHMRFEGPAVLEAQLSFLEDWSWATGTTLELDWTPKPSPNGNVPVLIAPTGPADDLETASLMFVHAINTATERIWIASPYFVPDDAIVQALQLAGLRGVDVRVIIPEKSDNKLVKLAAYSYFNEISSAGVDFYRYQGGFLHEKVMLVDERVATVGTANFDNRSFRLNFEITSLVIDSNFANEVEKMFERDFADSRIMEADEYDNKSFWFKLTVRISRLAAPVL